MKDEKRYFYKEDSTKGKSLIMPKSYKGDVVIQVWVDSRVLATLSHWLDKNDNYTRFMSDVVKDSLGLLVDTLVENGEELIDDTLRAREILERKYRVNLNKGERGMRNLKHNTLLTESRKALGKVRARPMQGMESMPIYSGDKVYSEDMSQEDLEKTIKTSMENALRKKKEDEEFKQRELARAMNSNLLAPGERNVEQVAKENNTEAQLEFLKSRVVKGGEE